MAESTVALTTGARGYEPVYQALNLINFSSVLKLQSSFDQGQLHN